MSPWYALLGLVILLTAHISTGCTLIGVGRKATSDGSVMVLPNPPIVCKAGLPGQKAIRGGVRRVPGTPFEFFPPLSPFLPRCRPSHRSVGDRWAPVGHQVTSAGQSFWTAGDACGTFFSFFSLRVVHLVAWLPRAVFGLKKSSRSNLSPFTFWAHNVL